MQQMHLCSVRNTSQESQALCAWVILFCIHFCLVAVDFSYIFSRVKIPNSFIAFPQARYNIQHRHISINYKYQYKYSNKLLWELEIPWDWWAPCLFHIYSKYISTGMQRMRQKNWQKMTLPVVIHQQHNVMWYITYIKVIHYILLF